MLACAGALTAAAAIWLSEYWGAIGALLAVAGFLAVAALVSFGLSMAIGRAASKQSDPVSDTIDGLWRTHPAAVMAVTGLAVFFLARKPMLITRAFTAIMRSSAAVLMLRKFL